MDWVAKDIQLPGRRARRALLFLLPVTESCYVMEGVPRHRIVYGKLRGWARRDNFVSHGQTLLAFEELSISLSLPAELFRDEALGRAEN